MTLVTPDEIDELCIDLLTRRHAEHLAKLERQRGLNPQTIERLATIDLLAGNGFRLREDKPPGVLLACMGTSDAPERRGVHKQITITWSLAMQIVTVGSGRADTLKRRSWYAMTIAECLLMRLPTKSGPVTRIDLSDIDLSNGAEERTQRTVAEAQLIFDVRVANAMDLTDLPLDDTRFPAGTPGGPPSTPYDPPVPLPEITERPIVNVDHQEQP